MGPTKHRQQSSQNDMMQEQVNQTFDVCEQRGRSYKPRNGWHLQQWWRTTIVRVPQPAVITESCKKFVITDLGSGKDKKMGSPMEFPERKTALQRP